MAGLVCKQTHANTSVYKFLILHMVILIRYSLSLSLSLSVIVVWEFLSYGFCIMLL